MKRMLCQAEEVCVDLPEFITHNSRKYGSPGKSFLCTKPHEIMSYFPQKSKERNKKTSHHKRIILFFFIFINIDLKYYNNLFLFSYIY